MEDYFSVGFIAYPFMFLWTAFVSASYVIEIKKFPKYKTETDIGRKMKEEVRTSHFLGFFSGVFILAIIQAIIIMVVHYGSGHI